MPAAGRLRARADFQAVYDQGSSHVHRLLVLRARRRDPDYAGDPARVGYAVGKRLGGAVIRNRIKRRLRAAVQQAAVPPGWDLVLVARAPVADADWPALRGAVDGLLARLPAVPAEAAPEARP